LAGSRQPRARVNRAFGRLERIGVRYVQRRTQARDGIERAKRENRRGRKTAEGFRRGVAGARLLRPVQGGFRAALAAGLQHL
jgi:hypothetical protein